MNKLFNKPYIYFWLAIPILILVGMLHGERVFVIDFYDIYFVIQNWYLILVISIAFSIFGFWYWLMHRMKRELIRWMTIAHVVVTIYGILLAFIIEHFFRKPHIELARDNNVTLIVTIILALVVLIQIIFPINLLLNLFKKPY